MVELRFTFFTASLVCSTILYIYNSSIGSFHRGRVTICFHCDGSRVGAHIFKKAKKASNFIKIGLKKLMRKSIKKNVYLEMRHNRFSLYSMDCGKSQSQIVIMSGVMQCTISTIDSDQLQCDSMNWRIVSRKIISQVWTVFVILSQWFYHNEREKRYCSTKKLHK